RQDFILDSIWLRSVEEGVEFRGTEELLEEGELLSEVFISEVLANVSGASEREVTEGGGGEGKAGGGRLRVSGSSSWNMSSLSVYALSSKTLKDDKFSQERICYFRV
ncbi:hypothetical protein XENORESO_014619, partial [Xenotaenia resolanae]